MRPLGSKRRNQSFFCSLVMILLKNRKGREIGGLGSAYWAILGDGRRCLGLEAMGRTYMREYVHSVP